MLDGYWFVRWCGTPVESAPNTAAIDSAQGFTSYLSHEQSLDLLGVVGRAVVYEEVSMRKVVKLWLVLGAVFALLLFGSVLADNGGRPFATTLTGAAEVPGPGDPDGIGTAVLRLNPGQEEICYELAVEGIAPARAAHIHVGEAGTAGPVVVGLAPPTNGTSSGCASASRELILAIIQNPELYYVNVHNAEYPAGALRGQLSQ